LSRSTPFSAGSGFCRFGRRPSSQPPACIPPEKPACVARFRTSCARLVPWSMCRVTARRPSPMARERTRSAPYLRTIRPCGRWVRPSVPVRVCSDPDDDVFLECSQASGADYLVTGNVRDFPPRWGWHRSRYSTPFPGSFRQQNALMAREGVLHGGLSARAGTVLSRLCRSRVGKSGDAPQGPDYPQRCRAESVSNRFRRWRQEEEPFHRLAAWERQRSSIISRSSWNASSP